MRILVIGRTGQVATELARRLPNGVFMSRKEADLSQPERAGKAVASEIDALAPEAVVLAAAYTAVDKAEDEEALAHRVNGAAPGEIARACAAAGVPLVHLSTDYVFDGSGDLPFPVSRPTGPLGAYGRSKLAGEEAVRAAGGVHVILRTSWVFSAHGANFVKTMLRLSETRDALRIVADQVGGPTPASALAQACIEISSSLRRLPTLGGTYHFSGAPDVSWADFAKEVFRQAGRRVTVMPIPTAKYPTPARRPLNSRLDCQATEAAFGVPRPDWRAELGAVLSELGVFERDVL